MDLNPEEQQDLEQASRAYAAEFNKPSFIVEDYMATWRSFVREVQSGYKLGIYDYTNSLTIRDILARFSIRLSDGLNSKLSLAIAPTDEKFRNATESTDVPLIGGPESNKQRKWWWHRIPKILEEEMKEDYESFRDNKPRPSDSDVA